MISTWFIHFTTLTAPTTYRAVCWSPWLQRLEYLFLTFRDLLSSVMLKVFQSKTRNWRRAVDYVTILPTESSPSHNLNPQQFQREYENGQTPRFHEIQYEDATKQNKGGIIPAPSDGGASQRAKTVSLLINTPDSGLQIFPFILHGTIQIQKQEGPRNLSSHFRNETQRSKHPTSSTC